MRKFMAKRMIQKAKQSGSKVGEDIRQNYVRPPSEHGARKFPAKCRKYTGERPFIFEEYPILAN